MSDAQRVRVKAARMLLAGKAVAVISQACGVARQTVYTWKAILDEGGIDALRAVPERGRPGHLDGNDLRRLDSLVRAGAQDSGFSTELWTLRRVGSVIKSEFGVKYSDVHVWRLLAQMGFSSQKPERRAIERNGEAVALWRSKT